DAIFIDK
ncbi:hypothetical protein D018_0018B, partial [Vibrio parahaemolyticus VP2007-007]